MLCHNKEWVFFYSEVQLMFGSSEVDIIEFIFVLATCIVSDDTRSLLILTWLEFGSIYVAGDV